MTELAFITKYKLRSTLKRIKGKNISDPIKQLLENRFFFFSKENLENIGVFILFIKDPYNFITTYNNEWKDSFTFIIEKSLPTINQDIAKCSRVVLTTFTFQKKLKLPI